MTTPIQTNLNPKIIPLGEGDDGRLHYNIQGKKFSVAGYDKDRFEKYASDVIDGRDRYYQFKANHSTLNLFRALGQLLILAGGTKAWKNTLGVLGGFTGYILSAQVSRLCEHPGYSQMRQANKNFETVDCYLENPGNAPRNSL